MKKIIIISSLLILCSCKKGEFQVYKFSYSIMENKEAEIILKGDKETVLLTSYKPLNQRGSWYILEEKVLTPTELESKRATLESTEKVRISNKDYTIHNCVYEHLGESKKGDIQIKE